MSNLFDLFGTGGASEDPSKPDIAVCMDFSNGGAYFQVVDSRKNPVTVDYRNFEPPLRSFLKSYYEAAEKQKREIKWMGTEEKIFLEDHPFLLGTALESGKLENRQGRKIIRQDEIIKLTCRIEGNTHFRSKLVCEEMPGTEILPVDREHVLLAERLYRVQDMGESFRHISGLDSSFEKEDLLPFLSLFFSHFPSIALDYRGYSIIHGAELVLRPVLTFSSIDRDGFLHLRIGAGHHGYKPDFFDTFDVTKAASVIEGDECIYVHRVPVSNTGNYVKQVKKLLNKIQREHELDYGYFQNGDTIAVSPKLGELFITREITGLSKEFLLFGTEHLARFKVTKSAPKMRLNIASGFDYLESDCEIEISGQRFTPKELLSAYRAHSYIPLNDGGQALIDPSFIARLERILKIKGSGGEVVLSFFDLPIVEELIEDKISGQGYLKPAQVFDTLAKIHETAYPDSGIAGTLRSYQEYGYKWLSYLGSQGLGSCLADDMGLGKTVQTIAALNAAYAAKEPSDADGETLKPASGPSLLVMPKSLIFNWKRELSKFAPDLSVYVYYDNARDMETALTHNIILTTYTLLRNDITSFREISFDFVILDEAQQIKNVSSQITKAVMLLKGNRRVAISGTPMENNLMELYSLFRFLNPPMFGSAADFTRRYLQPIQKEDDEEAAEDLRRKIYPFILRRLKRDVAKDLPEKVEQVLYVEMGNAQRDFYEGRKKYYAKAIQEKVERDGFEQSQMFIFQALAELRQIATVPEIKTEGQIRSAKREVILESLDDVLKNRHKAIIFSNYIGTLEYLAEDIEKLGYEYLFMSGATKDRMSLVEKFQTDSRYPVFLMTLKTGGVGLTLTEAEYVYIVDPWWNIAAENQAIDRAHRIGQKHTVFAYKLIAQDTIEERILTLQEQKRDLFNTVITNDHSMLKKFDADDMNYIFS